MRKEGNGSWINIRVKLMMALVCALSGGCVETISGKEYLRDNYWPGPEWRVSSPEDQGLSSARIHSFLRALDAGDRLHSVIVIRNGYLVTEAYYHPYYRGAREYMVSLGDCVMSSLVGIASKMNYDLDADTNVMRFFGNDQPGSMTPRRSNMAVRDLLTMRAAFDWQWKSDATHVSTMMSLDDPVSFILRNPMKENTGGFFSYSSANSHLISTILTKITGAPADEFAVANCFNPIGITTADWSRDAAGIPWGGFGLRMSALDMARFGYLYLRRGVWNGQEIVPGAWVDESVKNRVSCSSFPYDSEGFGFQWWIEPWGYSARGMSGHYLFVIPSRDIVVVITSEYQFYTLHQSFGNRYAAFDGELRDGPAKHYVSELVGMYLVAPSDGEARDFSAERRLAEYLKAVKDPEPEKIGKDPRVASAISGKTISFGRNPYRIRSIVLNFNRDESRITVRLVDGVSWSAAIGRDGRFVRTDVGGFDEIALRGSWTGSTRFELEEQEISESERFMYRFSFGGRDVKMKVIGSVSNQPVEVRGTIRN